MRIPRELREELVENLLSVPSVAGGGRAGRDVLLRGMPSVFLYRNESGNVHADVALLVTQSLDVFGEGGEWCLLQLVDNALPQVQGTEVGMKLLKIRRQLLEVQKGHWRVPAHPAEVARLHRFDLRIPVGICIWSLPDVPKVSGFVVTTPTPRLLGYFCDSLKQSGEDERRCWVRDEAAATGTPMVIDPKHTTVAVVVNKSDKVRSLLAGKHVLWPIYVDHAADAAALWRQLEGAFEKTLEHHLVITFGCRRVPEVPPGMTRYRHRNLPGRISRIGLLSSVRH